MSYRVLITGGTGSIGKEVARQLSGADITIFSRDESLQVLMKREYPQYNYVIGDVRDEPEVFKACVGMNYIFHFAALKHVNICEEQPQEAIKTNIIGTMNIINACHRHNCQLINMSSDKAINPINIYGYTKALGESMVNQAGYVNIRSGNVLWSSGSVLPIWKSQVETTNSISLTSSEMTRFFIHPKELALFIIGKKDKQGGTHMVPMKSFKLYHIAIEFLLRYGNEDSHIEITGLRSGERLHEFRDENTSSETYLSYDLSYIFE